MKNNFLKNLLLALVFCSPITLLAQDIPTSFLQKQWSARWIAVPNTDGSKYGVYLFRKSFDLETKPATFPIYISADNRYQLYVNGEMVGTGPAKGDLFNWNFDSIDLANYLKIGKNIVAVKVWNEAEFRPEFQITYQTGLIIQGANDASKVINTDKTWLCIQDKSYEPVLVMTYSPVNPAFEKTTVRGYYVAGPGEKITMAKHIKNWEKSAFEESDWSNAQAIAQGIPKNMVGLDGLNSWRLVPSIIPQMELTKQRFQKLAKVEGITPTGDFPKNGKLAVPANTKTTLLLDQAQLTNAYLTMLLSGGKDAVISLTYTEALFGAKDKGNRNEIEEIGRASCRERV